MPSAMNAREFARLAQSYGATLAHWPQDRRGPAQAWQEQHEAHARRVLEAERDIDAALARVPAQAASAALETQILARYDAMARPRPAGRWRDWLAAGIQALAPARPAWGMAVALLLVCGFAGGYAGYSSLVDTSTPDAVLASAFGGADADFLAEDVAT